MSEMTPEQLEGRENVREELEGLFGDVLHNMILSSEASEQAMQVVDAYVNDLHEQIIKLTKDKERLDFLESRGCFEVELEGFTDTFYVGDDVSFDGEYSEWYGSGKKLREAIDDAKGGE